MELPITAINAENGEVFASTDFPMHAVVIRKSDAYWLMLLSNSLMFSIYDYYLNFKNSR